MPPHVTLIFSFSLSSVVLCYIFALSFAKLEAFFTYKFPRCSELSYLTQYNFQFFYIVDSEMCLPLAPTSLALSLKLALYQRG